jgi:hypothetical protein
MVRQQLDTPSVPNERPDRHMAMRRWTVKVGLVLSRRKSSSCFHFEFLKCDISSACDLLEITRFPTRPDMQAPGMIFALP